MRTKQKNKNEISIIKSGACSRKKDRYEKKDADILASQLSQREGWRYNAYLCPKCKTYHVGHSFPRERTKF